MDEKNPDKDEIVIVKKKNAAHSIKLKFQNFPKN